ncbi:DUF1853 family protein [Tenacibaculum finnmarkense]|uniref:DUF1853 family protein n=1 Tax=Tenacibaculum finnmarkense TaxID=2781243 RepID=UPI001EFBFAD4|nr:DUF1853 family protein [Tenacibaculum finnmarkense]MCG8803066.1 DUF1853 family protein [Tenacibaculum finnmarkense]MCG8825881.1 DUF1853 family protein [Tenacibaculum finnmarkense]MCG8859151.1 DUF1853 family protein [Tenacibaculum finnmarkense]
MHQQLKDLQLQYEGFLKTPFLWNGKGVFDLQQFEINATKTASFLVEITKIPRLGKLVERFVSFEFKQDKRLQIIAENIQIQQEKITLGELDCLLLKDKKPIHVEIIYKFYLYDNSEKNLEEKNELERWIGPNKKDSLVQKLTKLKEKQLPLLYSKQCENYLKTLNLEAKNLEQQLYFKAQLFIPLNDFKQENHKENIKFPLINNDCIIGFYVTLQQLNQFKDYKFYIPTKHNWLVQPHSNTNWLNFNDFITNLQPLLNQERAPLCWLKKSNGELLKFFVIWW